MFKMLIDTCVWLDVAKDAKQSPALNVIEQLVRRGSLALIVPGILLDEFQKNRECVAAESAKSVTSHIRLVKDAVSKVGGHRRRVRALLAQLDDVGHKLPLVGGMAAANLGRIHKLLTAAPRVEVTDAVLRRASRRAVEKKAPFHHGKNAMADALLVETYAECTKDPVAKGSRFAFVTHNKNDFSSGDGDQRLPHADLRGLFSRVKSMYFITFPRRFAEWTARS